MRSPAWGGASLGTVPLSWVYRGLVAARNRWYDLRVNTRRAPVPVISIGNLAVGGTGKTPLVAFALRLLEKMGRRPSVVSRGYGGRAGRGPVRVWRSSGAAAGPRVSGDEPWMLAGRFPEVPIIVGSDRFAGVCAAADLGADVAVLDDGFQHRRLTRDLDVVVLSARDPLGNGRLLPAGPLREPAASLRRADLLVRVGGASESMESIHGVPEPRLGTLHAVRRSESWVDFRGEAVPKPDHVVAFCGIGTPRSFRELIESEGIAIDAFVGFPDHHSFSDAEIRRLVDLAVEHEAPLLTTEKDLARLDGLRVDPSIHGRLLGLRMSLEITNEQTLRVAFAEALGAKRTP